VEANCRAILTENMYQKTDKKTGKPVGPDRWNIDDYKKIERSHKLSEYQVKLQMWSGSSNVRVPFAPWATGSPLPWYQVYNTTKHDRGVQLHQATFEHMLDALCGVVAILSSQFIREDFSFGSSVLALNSPRDGFETAIGDYFRVKFPSSWSATDRYDFDWQKLSGLPDPFQNYVFPP
jgi:hypothetical protein